MSIFGRKSAVRLELKKEEISVRIQISHLDGRAKIVLTEVHGRSGAFFQGEIAVEGPLMRQRSQVSSEMRRYLSASAPFPVLPEHVVYGLGWMMWIRKNGCRLQIQLDRGMTQETVDIILHPSMDPAVSDDEYEIRFSAPWSMSVMPLRML